MRFAIVPASGAHVRALAEVLREGDRAEIAAMGMSPRRALWRSYRASLIAKAAFVDGELAAVGGMAGTFMGDTGQPWMFTSSAVERAPVEFVKLARQEIAHMLSFKKRLMNYVYADYAQAIGFLKLLGFTVDPPRPFGRTGAPFCRFHLVRRGPPLVRRGPPVVRRGPALERR